MHSHHSHSGDYVSHASDTLDTIVEKASDLKFEVYCLTEHMPRLHSKFLYPEELEINCSVNTLKEKFDNYYIHAKRIQNIQRKNKTIPDILVGFEVEGLNTEHIKYADKLRQQYDIDMVVGSVHFVKEIPIDFNRDLWEKSRNVCGSLYDLFREYFELQYEVLTELKPEVVGHFDLIRLFAQNDDYDSVTGKTLGDINIQKDWPGIWSLVIRNLKFIKSYGGLIELNSAAIRKKWETPYPKLDIANAVIEHCAGRFCFSDDSHAISQVGLNYDKMFKYVTEDIKLEKLYFLKRDHNGRVTPDFIDIETARASPFWDRI